MLGVGAVGAAAACDQLDPNFDELVALEIILPDSGRVEELDTLFPRARGLDGRGNPVDAAVYWAALDTFITVLDTTTGATLGRRPTGASGARLQARVENLRSNPVVVQVLPQADTALAEGTPHDTVTASAPDSLSDSLGVRLRDLTTASTPTELPGRPVIFTLTFYPAAANAATLVPNDTVVTNSQGTAWAQVRLLATGTRPDSVQVTAQALRGNGTTVPGTPITFRVEFQP